MKSVLIVEDDQQIADVLLFYLKESAFSTVHAADAAAALRAAETNKFDIILLDVMLPDINGVELCAQLQQSQFCPILFISCIDDEKTIINALHKGGDDYLVKPFTREMLLARMEANLRRMQRESARTPVPLACEGFVVDHPAHSIVKNNQAFALSPIEYNILQLLMEHPRTHFTLTEIYEKIWDKPSLGDARTVMVHIHNLRKKIEENPNEPKYIRSARGNGYYFEG